MNTDRMTAAEAVALCRFAKACCPQQQFDAYTPDAWFELLRDLRAEDCKEAIVDIVKRQPFVAPAEIRAEITRVRIRRLEQFRGRHSLTPPAEFADDPAGEMQWMREVTARVADGEITTQEQVDGYRPGRLVARDVSTLGLVGRRVPARD